MFPLRLGSVLTILFCGLLLTGVFPCDAQGADRERRLLKGSREMPLPSIQPLDYYMERSLAWLEALRQASPFLPSQALSRLWDMDCDSETGRLALAALLFPVEVATPDISSSRNIEVFLEEVEDPPARAAQVLDIPEIFLMQLSLMADMRGILKELEYLRSKALEDAESVKERLKSACENLEQIWNISRKLQKGEKIEAVLEEPGSDGRFMAAMIRACEKKLEARENQAALVLAEEAFIQLERIDWDREPEILRKYLQGRLMHLRGLAHWHQNQLALAEKDLSRAASLLNETGLPLELRGESWLDLGALRKSRRDIHGMCSAYREACAQGRCAPLAASRRQGVCQENGQP